MNPPKANGRGRERRWLTRDLGKAAPDFWAYVEQSYHKENVELPRGAVQTKKQLPIIHRLGDDVECEEEYEARRDYLLNEYLDGGLLQKDGETDEEYNNRVLSNPDIPFRLEHSIPEMVLANIFKKWLQDPYECSLKLGDERIANLDKLSTRDAIKLNDMGDYYFNWIPTDRDQATETERKKIVKWWNDFIRITNKIYLDELDKPDIEHYTSTITDTANNDNRSRTWVAHRFGACRTVINTFAKSLDDKVLCKKVAEWFKDFPAPKTINGKTDDFNPNRLIKDQWLELLAVVSNNCRTQTQKEWRAITLFALNTCSYGVTCRNVMMSNIDGNELRARRGKRGKTPKIGILWDDTLEAIAEFRQGKIANSKYMFPSRTGSQYSEGGFYDYWMKFIRPKLSWDFNFNQLRDSGRYGAETGKASPNHIHMAMGHRLKGTDDAYLFRHPELVQDVSDAIYNYYMV